MRKLLYILFFIFCFHLGGISIAFSQCTGATNDLCSNAITLTVNGATLAGTTCGATISPGELTDCADSGTDQSVWYKFTATAATLDVDIAPTGICPVGAAIWPSNGGGCPITSCSAMECQSAQYAPDPIDFVLSNLTIGDVYYVQVVFSPDSCTYGTFDINVSNNISPYPTNPAPMSTCENVSGPICVFNNKPSVNTIIGACPGYANGFNDDTTNNVVSACFSFVDQFSSSIAFQIFVDFNIDTSCCRLNKNCITKPDEWFDWTLYDNSCNNIACGKVSDTTASGLICGNTYEICYEYEIPSCQKDTKFWPYISAIPPTFTTSPNTSICNGNPTTLTANATGYVSYTWAPSAGLSATTGATVTANPTVTTTYTVTGFDVGGCTQSKTVTITVKPDPIGTLTPTNASCGLSNGAVTVAAGGASGPYTYLWTTGATTPAISNLSASSYTVTVTSANGCTVAGSAPVSQSGMPVPNITSTNTTCDLDNGSVSVAPTGGAGSYTYKWTTGATTSTINNLGTGSYNVTVTDANGCTADASATLSNSTSPPTVNDNTLNASCGLPNGLIYLTVSTTSSSAPTYLWSNGDVTQEIFDLAAGTYSVTVKDENGCTVTLSVTIIQTGIPTLTVTPTQATCNLNNGSVTVNANGGAGFYTYLWSTGSVSKTINNLPAGSYTVTVTDLSDCTVAATATVIQAGSPTAITTPTQATCNLSNGSVTVAANGGSGTYTYKWTTGATTATINNLAAGSYTATVTDGNGCTAKATAIITQAGSPTVSATPTPATCNLSNGSVAAATNGGSGSYIYLWTTGATSSTINNLPAGSYTVTVTDANGCTAKTTATITQAGSPTATATPIAATCNLSNGSVTAAANGGGGSYTYDWTTGATTSTITNLSASSYTVTVTDANSCTTTATATVTQAGSPTATATPTPATCNLSNGSVVTAANGGSGSYTYQWTTGATTSTISNLGAGSYAVTITDANSCTTTATATVSQAGSPTASATPSPATCNLSNGSATVMGNGGSGPGTYTYKWTTGATTATINNLAAGSYTATVADGNGCTAKSTAVVTQAGSPTAGPTSTNATCNLNNGSVTVTANGGAGGYTYLWTTGGTSQTINNLAAGSYSVTVKDINGCTATTSAAITQTGIPTATPTPTDATCSLDNGSVTVVAAAGAGSPYTYQWTTGATTQTINGIGAGNYTVTVTDASGCTVTAGTTVTTTTAPTVSVPAETICNGGSGTTLTASGASTYTWSPGTGLSATTGASVTANPASTTTYTVDGMAANGCSATTTVILTVNNTTPVFTVPSPSICSGSSWNVNVNCTANCGGTSYSWEPATGLNNTTSNSVTASPTVTTTYTVTATSSTGCTTSATSVVTISNPVYTDSTACSASGTTYTIYLKITGGTGPFNVSGVAGTLTGNNFTSNPINAGDNETISVSSTNGCPTTKNITVPNCVVNTANSCSSVTGCFSSNLIVDGNFQNYTQANPGFTTGESSNGPCVANNNLCGGEYMCTGYYSVGTSPTPCNPTWLNISGQGNIMMIDFSQTTLEAIWCQTVTLTPNTNYCFSAFFINLDPPGSGTPDPRVSFYVNGVNSSTAPAVPEDGLWHNYGYQFNSGAGGSTDLCIYQANVGFIGYDMALDNISLYGETSGTPPDAVADNAKTCINSAVSIPVLNNDIAGSGAIDPSTLSIATYPLVTQGTASVSGSDIQFTPVNGYSGIVIMTYKICDVDGCCDTADVSIDVSSNLTVTVPAVSVCKGSAVTLNATSAGATGFTWSPSAGLAATIGSSVSASPGSTSTYTVDATNGAGCTGTATTVVTVNPKYTKNVTGEICVDGSYNLPWGGTVITGGTYSHTYTSINGCDSLENLTLTVVSGITTNVPVRICQGASFNLPWGGSVNTAGTYSHTYPAVTACDSVVNIILTINSVFTTGTTATICQGSSYALPWGGSESTAGTYSHTYASVSGCDSVVNIALAVNPVYSMNQNASICQGATYTLPWGGSESIAGTYSHTYTSVSGCDSVVNIALNVNSILTTTLTPQICQGATYTLPWGGSESTAGTYSHTYASVSGCDSVVNIVLTVNPVYSVNQTASICQGSSYTLPWGGSESTAGTYSNTYTSVSGCDSVVNIALTVNPVYAMNQTASICQGATYALPWGGSETTAGTYSHTYTSVSGCDSVVNIALTVNPVYAMNQTASICQGATYALPWGGSETTAGTYSHTYTSVSGCDSVVNIALTVNSILTTNLTPQICQGATYALPWGGSESTAGTYSHTYTSVSGCDSVVNIVLTVNSVYSVNQTASICQGSSYTLPWGGSKSTAGTYSHTYTSVSGCDSVVNITLTVNPVYSMNQTASICQGATYALPWGGSESTAGTYSHTYASVSGCDSVVNITLTVNPVYSVNQTASICQGATYALPWGGSESTAGTYSHTYTSVSGCDSVVNITLTVNPVYSMNQTASICQGSSYTLPWGGSEITAGTYSNTYASVSGCDSVVNITLTVNAVYSVNQTASICQGATYTLPWGGSESIAGTYSHTYTSVSGCDSVVNIALNVNSILTTTLTPQICQGATYTLPWGGSESTAGTYSHTYASVSGCDSVVNIVLTVNPVYSVNQTASICQGSSYTLPWGGSESTAGTYSNTYTSVSGCDSVVNIALTVNPVYAMNQTASICQGATYALPWGGSETTAGTYSHTYTSVSGCDSVVNIALTVNPVYAMNQTASICQGATYALPWGGSETTAGTYSHTYTSVSGCDSVVNIALNVNSILTTNLTPQICQGATYALPWGGSETTAGTYSNTYASVSGCDSVVNITLTVNPVYSVNQTASICQGATYTLPWGGSEITAGTYSNTYASVSGCDSVVNITLTVNPVYSVNQTASICQGATYALPWGGSESTVGTYSHTYASVSGCDSVVNIALAVNPVYSMNQNASICQGATYTLPWGGSEITAGTYSHTYASVSGCDSVVNIALAVNPVYSMNQNASICQGATYALPWGGSESIAGTYSHTYTSVSGCDSVVNITLTVNPVYSVNQTASICQGATYALPWGGSESTAGTYSHTYTSVSGCDSVVNIALTVNPVYAMNQTASICQGATYALPWGGSETTAGTYSHTYTSVSGCDSVVNIALTVNSILTTNLTPQICQGSSYTLPWGGTESTGGTYSHTYTSVSGCDSVVNIALTVNSILTTNLTPQICQGATYTLPWGGSATIAGTYSHTYASVSGCDSVVNIALAVNPVYSMNQKASICQGATYTLPWGGSESIAGTYSHTYTSVSGCDSVVNIALNVNSILTTTLTPQICQGATYTLPWGGSESTAGTYSNTYASVSGCDSVVNIILTVNPVYSVNQTASICQGATYTLPWGGSEIIAGTYSNTYASVSGCDSVVNITLTVNPVYAMNQTASICQGATYALPWGGSESTAGTYSNTYTSVSGCDSVVNIALTVNPVYAMNQTASICQGATYALPWGGSETTAGTYSHTYTSVSGCDSVVNIALTVNPVYAMNQTASICQGATYALPWGGSETTAGTYSHTYTSVSGCDSVVNIALTVNSILTTNLTPQICQGSSYTLPWGGTESTGGTYSHTYTSVSGCDSVVNIALTVNSILTTNLTPQICQGATYTLPWGGSATIAGTYSHTYASVSGCDSVVNITLTVNPVYSMNQTASICQGSSYTLPWGGSESTAGTYSNTYTSVSGCDSVVNITLTVNPVYSMNQTASICQGATYTLPWGGSESTAGTYSHTYTSVSGCDSVVNIALNVNSILTTNLTPQICQGATYALPWGGSESTADTYSHTYTSVSGCDSVVNIALTVNPVYMMNQTASICQGATYALPWGGSESTAGTYSHTYTSVSGCDSVVNIALNVNSILTTNLAPQICQGATYALPWGGSESTAGTYSHAYTSVSGCDSVVNITLTVNPVYSVNQTASTCEGATYALPWGGSESTAGTYSHTYTSVSGCDSVVNIALTVNPVYSMNQNASICQGATYTLPWGGSESTAGTYSHTYTSVSDCDSVVNIALTVNPVYTVNQNTSICQGSSYTLPWGGSETTAGTYSHTYTSVSGCDSVVNIALNVNSILTTNLAPQICQGATYALPWGGSESTAGTYSHTYTSVSGCDSVVNIALTVTVNPTTTATATPATCNLDNGTVKAAASGGTGKLTYNWSNTSATQNISNLGAGTYSVTVTDSLGCSTTAGVLVVQHNSPVASVTGLNAKCGQPDGTVNLTVNGGASPLTYKWSNGATTQNIAGITANNYSVTVTDLNGCADSAKTTLINLPGPTLTGVINNTTCGYNNGSVNITVKGGTSPYNYLWSNGATTQNVSGLTSIDYLVTVTDSNHCKVDSSFAIPGSSEVQPTITPNTIICGQKNGLITLTVTGGASPYKYLWTNGATTKNDSNLVTGDYFVTVSDSNKCTVVTNATILCTAGTSCLLSLSNTTNNASCFSSCNGAIDLIVNNGARPFKVNWSNGATTDSISGLCAGNYSVTMSDNIGCKDSLAVNLLQPSALKLISTAENVACSGGASGAIYLTVSGGTAPYTYSWSNYSSARELLDLKASSYSVTVKDANNCSADAFQQISQPNPLLITESPSPDYCNRLDGAARLVVTQGTPPYSYLWSNKDTTNKLSGVAAGEYYFTITDDSGCVFKDSVSINEVPRETITLSSIANTLCSGQSVTLTASGSQSYRWTPSTGLSATTGSTVNIFAITSQTDTVISTDRNGCMDTALYSLTVHPMASADFKADSLKGCSPLSISFINESINASGYSWSLSNNTGSTETNPTFTIDSAGSYSLSLIAYSQYGCNDTFKLNNLINVYPNPTAAFTSTPTPGTVIALQSATVYFQNQSTGAGYYYWNFGDGTGDSIMNPVHQYDSASLFNVQLIVMNQYGCRDSAREEEIIVPNGSAFIPNTFTPNRDGHNDYFRVYGVGITWVKMKVFDRWGALVFESEARDPYWDGTFFGKPMNTAVFVYLIEIDYQDNSVVFRHGDVTLLR